MVNEIVEVLPSGELRRSDLRRIDVVNAFHYAFQVIGGVPRLALWADQQPGEFYKLYSRLLPSSASDVLVGEQVIEIVHALAPPPIVHENNARIQAQGDIRAVP